MIGPGVVNPYHSHPSLIATNLACLNEETDGNSFIMMGRGAFHDLFEVSTSRPMTTLKESIDIIHNLLSGETADYDGRVFKARKEGSFAGTAQQHVFRASGSGRGDQRRQN